MGKRVGLAVTVAVAVGGMGVAVNGFEVAVRVGSGVIEAGTALDRTGPLQADKKITRAHIPIRKPLKGLAGLCNDL